MKTLVILREVPDTEAAIVVNADGKSINTHDVKYIINPYDEYAIEAAALLSEEKSADAVLVAVGNNDMAKNIRNALAKSASKTGNIPFSKVIHLQCNEVLDSYAVAVEVAKVVSEENPDLVFLGKQYIDDDDYLMGPYIAGLSNRLSVTVVTKMTVTDSTAELIREIEGGAEKIIVPFPAVISLQKGVNEPRYAGMKGIMNAKKNTIEVREIHMANRRINIMRCEPPAAKAAGRIISGDNREAQLAQALRDEAKVI